MLSIFIFVTFNSFKFYNDEYWQEDNVENVFVVPNILNLYGKEIGSTQFISHYTVIPCPNYTYLSNKENSIKSPNWPHYSSLTH